jgi:hypothetical protein
MYSELYWIAERCLLSPGELPPGYQGAGIQKGDGRREYQQHAVRGYGGNEAVRCIQERRELNALILDIVGDIKICVFITLNIRSFAFMLRFFRAFSSVVRQMPGYNSKRRGTARTFQTSFKFFDCYVCSVLCILCTVCVSMCTVLLPPGVNPTAVKYISYHIIRYSGFCSRRNVYKIIETR